MPSTSSKSIEKLHEEFIYKSRYARWNHNEGRRENWDETVNRYFDFFRDRVPDSLIGQFDKAKNYVLNLDVMPSMRALWSSGDALRQNNIAGYNCSALPINYVRAFADICILLMNGAGVGISVERQFINELPKVKLPLVEVDKVIVVEDSKEGWADSIYQLTLSLFDGEIPKIDVSKVRPAGAILKTFGGRASGSAPLLSAMRFMIKTFKNIGSDCKLSSLDCHDIACAVASAIVVGGVRRCLSGDTLVLLSDRTWKPIKDVEVGSEILFEEKNVKVSGVVDNDVQEVVDIILEDNSKMVCTKEHRWFVYNKDIKNCEWVETDNLDPTKHFMLKKI
jgi:ribonucleoside-triphosphate reductase (thioredoxin)